MCKRYIARACVNFVFSDCVVSSRPFPYLPPQKGELRTYKYHCGIDFWVRKLNILATAVLFFVWRSGRAGGGGQKERNSPLPHLSAIVKENSIRPFDYVAFSHRVYVGNSWICIAHYWRFVGFPPRTDIDGSIYGFRLIRFNRDIKN